MGPIGQPLVSIIVPVYNVKQYLRECFSSLAAQTYRAIEVLLVDDGSTDGSGKLCDELAASDGHVRVLHKQNGGLSDARNYGVEHCAGEYVCFVDSDDYVSPVFVESLVSAMRETGCPMAAYPFATPFEDGERLAVCETMEDLRGRGDAAPLSSKAYIDRLLYHTCDTGAYCRIYTVECLRAHSFPVGVLFEDAATVYRMVHDQGDVALLPDAPLYAYRQRSGSIIHSGADARMVDSAIEIGRQVESDMRMWYPDSWLSACSCGFSINRVALMRTTFDQRDYRDRLWAEMRRYRAGLLRDGGAKPVKRVAATLSCLGMGPFMAFSRAFDRAKGGRAR